MLRRFAPRNDGGFAHAFLSPIELETGVQVRRVRDVAASIRRDSGRICRPFFRQVNALDARAALHRLDHVVDREACHGDGCQRLHLDPGRAGDLDRGANYAARQPGVGRDLDRDFRQCQRVTQRDQVRRALRGHDAGNPRGAEHVALLGVAALDQSERRLAHDDASLCHGHALGGGLGGDVHHPRLTPGVDMGEGRTRPWTICAP